MSGPVRYKSRIPSQGLILILIPLSVGSLILLALIGLCSYAEGLAQKERNQSKILGHYNMSINYWSQAIGNLLGRAFADDQVYDKQSAQYISHLENELEILNELPKSREKAEAAEKLETLCMHSIKELSDLPVAKGTGPISNLSSLQYMPRIFNRLYVMPAKVKLLLEQEGKSLKHARKLEDQQLLLIKRTAYSCIFGNILLAIVLVWIFAKRITERLNTLTSNAGLLPRLEPLKEKVSGDDELAYLSEQLEITSEKLIAAAEHRRSIFGMVAHDMRSPITAAQLCLEVTGELFQAPYTNDSDKDLESARMQLQVILAHVNKLLAIERRKQEGEKDNEAVKEGSLLQEQAENNGNTNGDFKEAETESAPESLLSQNPSQQILNMKTSGAALALPLKFFAEFLFAPKIFHKGLLLVLVPLTVQIAILCSVNSQLNLLEGLMEKERKLGDIVMRINLTFLDALKATTCEALYLLSNESSIRKTVNSQFEQILANASAELNVNHDEEWTGLLKSWRKLIRQHLAQFSDSSDSPAGEITASMTEKVKSLKPIQKATVKLRNRITKKFDKESKAIEELEKRGRESQKQLAQTLSWGLIANIVLALTLLWLFNKDVSSRLKQLLQHTSQLASLEPISTLVPGKDELSYLDLILHHSQEQLIAASKERSEMMSIIAQDMERPLNLALQGVAQFIEKENELPARVQKQVDRAQHNIKRVLLLIDDLVTMETLETGKIALELAPCNLRSLAEESIATVTSLAKQKNIEIANECAELTLKADKARLIQTLINYLTNAIKFSPPDTRIRVHNNVIDDRVRVLVSDQGPGMDENTRNRVFEKFFQAESPEKKQGFGLGLAICGLIVESHGGQLGVDSEPGKGSSFWFEIPRAGTDNLPLPEKTR